MCICGIREPFAKNRVFLKPLLGRRERRNPCGGEGKQYDGSGSQQGMDMTFAGTTKGKETWYFAMKEGLFIKSTSETTTEMSIDVPAAGMTIPATATAKAEVKLTAKQ